MTSAYVIIAILVVIFVIIYLKKNEKYDDLVFESFRARKAIETINEFDNKQLYINDICVNQDSTHNWAAIELYYLEQAKKQMNAFDNDYFLLRFSMGFALITSILVLVCSYGASQISIFFTFYAVLNISISVYYYWSRAKKVKYELSKKNYITLNRLQFMKLWDVCDNLLSVMFLKNYDFEIIYSKSNERETYIICEYKTIYLVLSRPILANLETELQQTESIIAHEFGHILQGDFKDRLINKNIVQLTGVVSIFNILVYIVLIVMLIENHFQNIFDYFMYFEFMSLSYFGADIMRIRLLYQVIVHRRKSENLADLAALIYVKDSKIRDIISKVNQRFSLSYPSNEERITYIDNTMKKFIR